MPKRWFNERRHRAFSYLRIMNRYISPLARMWEGEPDLLYSFVGAVRSRLRAEIMKLRKPGCWLEDTSQLDMFNMQGPAIEQAKRRYAEILLRSRFVLCPRGAGTSSFRLYEAMEAGRVPVIISDQWVPPSGPKWESFMIRVPEARVHAIPQLISQHEPFWKQMGQAARDAWESWFAPDVAVARLVQALRDLDQGGRCKRPFLQGWATPMQGEILLRNALRPMRNALREVMRKLR